MEAQTAKGAGERPSDKLPAEEDGRLDGPKRATIGKAGMVQQVDKGATRGVHGRTRTTA